MYASAGSTCTLAPVVPKRSVSGGGTGDDEADEPMALREAAATAPRVRSAPRSNVLLPRRCSRPSISPPPITRLIVTKGRLGVNRRRPRLVEVGPGDGSDAGRPLPRARRRPRPLLVGAGSPRARAHEARSPAPPVPREVRAAARRGAARTSPAAREARSRPVRRVGHDARPVAREPP